MTDVAAFKAHIDRGGMVEAGDWMPDEYRQGALQFIEMHANSEIMGALTERDWITRAPSLRRKLSLAAKVQDEVGHGHMLYRVAEDLGKPRAAMIADLVAGRARFHNVFHYRAATWGDIAVIGFLVDGAALVTQRALLRSSYAPYVRVLRRICAEESLHQRHGESLVLELCAGSNAQRALFQEAVNRWWEPIMGFFGPPSDPSRDRLLYWRLKVDTNETLRQRFLDDYVPRLWDLGISVPDATLAPPSPDGDGEWRWTPPDWDAFREVIRGSGPQTQAQLERLRQVHDTHAWVREVMREPAGVP